METMKIEQYKELITFLDISFVRSDTLTENVSGVINIFGGIIITCSTYVLLEHPLQ